MNERIKELVKQAGGIGHDDDGNELTPVLVGKDLEKFAELIVKECAKACEKNSWMALNGFQRSKQIKEHFGVEE